MKPLYTAMILTSLAGLAGMNSHAEPLAGNAAPETAVETLLQKGLDIAPDTNVIIDRVTLPPHTTLSRRWHPGEMFIYVMDGSVVLSPDGKDERVGNQGDVMDVPFKQVYAARTNSEGARVLLFRVHEAGQPIRVKVE